MLKKTIIRKSIISLTALVVALLFYIFPNSNEIDNKVVPNKVIYNKNTDVIYLLDEYSFVAKTEFSLTSNNDLEKVKEIITTLTINGENKHYIPNGFKAIIPMNTKIINMTIDNKILKINFSKSLLDITESKEEKMIESIVYSLTSLDCINKVLIFVEGQQLIKLPHSNKLLPPILTRDYGINKKYEINTIKELKKINVYHLANKFNYYYSVPITVVKNSNKEKIELIIEELKSSTLIQSNLLSYITTNNELLDYQILNDQIILNFKNNIYSNYEEELIEEIRYCLKMIVKENYEQQTLIINENNQLIDKIIIN